MLLLTSYILPHAFLPSPSATLTLSLPSLFLFHTLLHSARPSLLALLSPFPRWFVCSLSLYFLFSLPFTSLPPLLRRCRLAPLLRRLFFLSFRTYVERRPSLLRANRALARSFLRSGLFHSIDIYPSPLGQLAEWSRWLVPSARLLFLSRGGQRVLILCRKVVRNPPDPFARPRMTLILKYYLGPPPVPPRVTASLFSSDLCPSFSYESLPSPPCCEPRQFEPLLVYLEAFQTLRPYENSSKNVRDPRAEFAGSRNFAAFGLSRNRTRCPQCYRDTIFSEIGVDSSRNHLWIRFHRIGRRLVSTTSQRLDGGTSRPKFPGHRCPRCDGRITGGLEEKTRNFAAERTREDGYSNRIVFK